MDNQNNLPVLIAGAGPTGLVLACDLARRGIHFRIIDKAHEFFKGSRGKGLQPRSLEILEDIGVIDQIVANGDRFPVFRMYAETSVLADRTLFELLGSEQPVRTAAIPYPEPWVIPQWRTEEILRERLSQFGYAVELATELTGFTQNEDGVRATLFHNERTETITASFIIGADGGRSFVRKHSEMGFEGSTYETERTLIADVQADGPDREHCHMFTIGGNMKKRVSLWPLPHTNTYQFIATMDTEDVPDLTLESLQKILEERSGRTDIHLHDMSWISLYRVNIRMAQCFRKGRVFLAGDAAHVHSSAGGQGLNTSIQDAYNLGWKLDLFLKGAPEDILDTYEAERLPIAADVLGLTTRLHQQGFSDATKPVDKQKKVAQDIFQLHLNYRNGPLAFHETSVDSSIQAGDRAPDALCTSADGKQVRLFDVLKGPHFTLLAFGSKNASMVREINRQYGTIIHAYLIVQPDETAEDFCIIDHEGSLQQAYAIQKNDTTDTLILIRPDGYIGVIAPGNSAALDHYYRLFVQQQVPADKN